MKHGNVLEIYVGILCGIFAKIGADAAITNAATKLLLVAASGFVGGAFALMGKIVVKCVLNRFKK